MKRKAKIKQKRQKTYVLQVNNVIKNAVEKFKNTMVFKEDGFSYSVSAGKEFAESIFKAGGENGDLWLATGFMQFDLKIRFHLFKRFAEPYLEKDVIDLLGGLWSVDTDVEAKNA
jgi:hypothetical protein